VCDCARAAPQHRVGVTARTLTTPDSCVINSDTITRVHTRARARCARCTPGAHPAHMPDRQTPGWCKDRAAARNRKKVRVRRTGYSSTLVEHITQHVRLRSGRDKSSYSARLPDPGAHAAQGCRRAAQTATRAPLQALHNNLSGTQPPLLGPAHALVTQTTAGTRRMPPQRMHPHTNTTRAPQPKQTCPCGPGTPAAAAAVAVQRRTHTAGRRTINPMNAYARACTPA
jgi:hypothetical protein